MKDLIPIERIEHAIFLVRGQKVILDDDLSRLYGVTTKRLNEQVKRNRKRFPDDFMFQLNLQEVVGLRSHFATLNSGSGRHRKYLPYAFTEHGVIMAANVLNSQRAIEASVCVVRAFVRLRALIASNKELAKRLDEIEKKYDGNARIIHECRSEAIETEARRGFSQARTTQAYSQRYVEEAEREKPRRARGSAAAVGVHEWSWLGSRSWSTPSASS